MTGIGDNASICDLPLARPLERAPSRATGVNVTRADRLTMIVIHFELHCCRQRDSKAHTAVEHNRRYRTETHPGTRPDRSDERSATARESPTQDAACLPSRGTSSLTIKVKLRRRPVVPADHGGWGQGGSAAVSPDDVAVRRGRAGRERSERPRCGRFLWYDDSFNGLLDGPALVPL